ncbi:hypothetical protein Vi05172_g8001 [Venturia inaequalis]|nr:hypothetical protein Vi05172_g8001 [Venturia inaequalis]
MRKGVDVRVSFTVGHGKTEFWARWKGENEHLKLLPEI